MQIYSKGFVLIEMLVALAIVTFFSSIVAVGVIKTLNESKNAAALTIVKQYEIALELFYNENGYYPATSDPVVSCMGVPGVDTCVSAGWQFSTPTDQYHRLDMLEPNYIKLTKSDIGSIGVFNTFYRGAVYNCRSLQVVPVPKCFKFAIMWPIRGIKCLGNALTFTDGINSLCERMYDRGNLVY